MTLSIDVPHGYFVCDKCCGLMYPIQRPLSANVEDRMHQPNTVPRRCSRCASHRGDDWESVVRRAEDHAKWYWEFSEQKEAEARAARAEVVEIKVQIGDVRDRMIAAFRSRDAYIGALADIAEHHQRSRDGCSCRRRNCETLAVVDQAWVRRRISDVTRRTDYDEFDSA